MSIPFRPPLRPDPDQIHLHLDVPQQPLKLVIISQSIRIALGSGLFARSSHVARNLEQGGVKHAEGEFELQIRPLPLHQGMQSRCHR